jgi:hypothetical protein
VLKQLPPLVRSLHIWQPLPPLQQRQWAVVLLVLLCGLAQQRVVGLRACFDRQGYSERLLQLLVKLKFDLDRFNALRDLCENR